MKNDPIPKSKESAQSPSPEQSHPLTTLAEHLYALKRLPRTGWRDRGLSEVETVASHSFGVVVWTLWLAERKNLQNPGSIDLGHVLKLATLHDLPEAQTGDLTPTQKRLLFGDSKQEQKQAIAEAERRYWRQWGSAPDDSALSRDAALLWKSWGEDFEEYRLQQTPEARIVKQADALDCVWQALSYRRLYRDALEEFRYLLKPASGEDLELLAWLTLLWDSEASEKLG
jgi:putative hydrolase of HD superfamily